MTKAPSQPEIVTFAVFLLGGDQKFIDTEDIAKKAHHLSPGRFSWRKYPDQINLELVRVFLSDAKKVKNGGLLNGSGKKGWTLTPAGLQWAREHEGSFVSTLATERQPFESKAGSVDSQRNLREYARICATAAWRKWDAGDMDISLGEAQEVFRIDSYARGHLAKLKTERLRKLMMGDEAVDAFLKGMAEIVLEGQQDD